MVWSEKGNRLSERLQVMADKVCQGETCADIGTDHGYLPLYLYEKGICPRVILTDISEASLAKAKAAAGASQYGNSVDFRVGYGLNVLDEAEVDCVVIAGMGGKLIRDILSENIDKTNSFRRFVLQPRTATGPLRKWLLEADFAILSEDIVREGDYLPEIITCAPKAFLEADPDDFDYFEKMPGIDISAGIRETLVEDNDEDSICFSVPMWILNAEGPVLEYLDRRIETQNDILAGLKRATKQDAEQISKTEWNIDYLNQIREIRILREKVRTAREKHSKQQED